MASQPSPASSNGSIRKEVFLPYPPLPFDSNHEGDEYGRNHDLNEDWLPEIKDILTDNFHVMIDMTSELVSEDDADFPSRYTRSESGTSTTTASPTRLQSAPYGQKLPQTCQPPKPLSSIDFEQAKIQEQPSTVQGRLIVSGPSDRCDNRDSGRELMPITAITKGDNIVEEWHIQEKEDQERGEINNDSGPPKAPIPAFTVQALKSSLISARQSQEVVQDSCTHTQTASPTVLPVRDSACTEKCIAIQDITFLRVEGQRETADGSEYQFVAKMWLRPGTGIQSNLVHVYRKDVDRQARLATLRTRKRMSEDASVIRVKRSATGKAKQAQI